MHVQRVRNKILQRLYRPRSSRRVVLSPQTIEALDEINEMIEKKITPLLSGLWKDE